MENTSRISTSLQGLLQNKKLRTITVIVLVALSSLAVTAFTVRGITITVNVCTLVATSRGALTTAAIDNAPNSAGEIDAHGCDIGDYIVTSGTVVNSMTIHDANQYGIFVDNPSLNAISVTIQNTNVYRIGNHDVTGNFVPNGVQTGIGIIFDSGASGQLITGNVLNNNIYEYQKNGMVVNHNSNVTTFGNFVTGLGHVNFIAQNGIEYARDAVGTIENNVVSANFYTGNTGILANGEPCGGAFPACPPGRQFVSAGILLVLINPDQITKSHNDLNAPPPNDNQLNFAVITDSPLG